jgi:putative ABC transport system permease protein
MSLLLNFFSVIWLAMKRLWSNRALTLATMLGLVVAVALVTSVPLYSDAVNYQLMREELSRAQSEGRPRPPFAFMYRYVGAWHGAIEWDSYAPLDSYFAGQGPATIGLPLELQVRHVKTDNFRLFPASEAEYADIRKPLEWVNIGVTTELKDHIRVVEGDFPQTGLRPNGAIEVLISYRLVEKLGLQPGEDYVLFSEAKEDDEGRRKREQVPVHISGVWEALDGQEPYWFYDPGAFEKVLFLPEESFIQNLVPRLDNEVYLAVWYFVFDGEEVHTQQAPGLLGRIVTTESQVTSILPDTALDVSPKDALLKYRQQAQVLTVLLYVFSIPIVGLVLYFIALVSGMVVQRQKNEISVLKSRGTSNLQILGIYLLEGVLVGAVALVGGPFGGRLIAQVMGNIKSFLAIVQRPPLPVVISSYSLRLGAGAVGIAILTSLVPALGAAQLTIVSYKQELARSLRRPFWQRYFLDFIILAAPLYGYYLLRQQGTISVTGEDGATGNPFQNPLLFLVPTLFIFAVALVFMRFFPLLMRFLSWLGQYIGGISSLLALRQLARSAQYYTGPLLLLILTLSLAAFSASMAQTLDTSLYDQTYYRTGGEVLLLETGWDNTEGEGSATAGGTGTLAGDEEEEDAGPQWYFLPVADHLKVPGVEAATRVGQYTAVASLQKQEQKGQFVGIDRLDFPNTAVWRRDYAYRTLGALMNELATDRSGILVSPSFLGANSLYMGDKMHLRIGMTFGQSRDIEFTVRGTIDYFPTLYPEDGPIFVGNLDYVFEQMGGEFPYDVWIRVAPWANVDQVVDDLGGLQFRIMDHYDARIRVAAEQARPERRGIFGLLSVGFVAAAVLTVMGFLLYSFISFRRRFIELGVLRAIGLSVPQMGVFLAFEQFFLVAIGIVVGMGLGTWASSLFIPFFQVGSGQHPQTPPFVVLVAWDDVMIIVGVFAAMFVVAIMGMIWLLSRMRVFQAIKMGEATL